MKQKVSIIGLGYVGLPLALLAASKGFNVQGVDASKKRLSDIESKIVKIDDIYVASLLAETTLLVSDLLYTSDIYVVCVPTPVNERNEPDLTPIFSALDKITAVVEDDQLIVIESTIYPGMCEDIILPFLQKSNKRIRLAHCPERVNPGDSEWHIHNIPRVVGGIDYDSVLLAFEFYSQIIGAKVLMLNSIRSAEASKILENIFRDVNIALANEMAQAFYRMNIDSIEVIQAASTKPFAFMPHWPGIGVGGHCIAVDPYYMIEKGRLAGFDHEFLKLARKINSSMPIYTVNLLQNALNLISLSVKGTKIGVYGLSYKPNIGDIRESPSFEIIKKLRNEKNADVKVYDPFIKSKADFETFEQFIEWSEVLVVCTAHSEIIGAPPEIFGKLKLIIDGRNCLNFQKLKELGVYCKGIGRT